MKEYYDDGFICLFCKSIDSVASTGEPTNTGSTILQNAECLTCSKEWTEVYRLEEVRDIKTGKVLDTTK